MPREEEEEGKVLNLQQNESLPDSSGPIKFIGISETFQFFQLLEKRTGGEMFELILPMGHDSAERQHVGVEGGFFFWRVLDPNHRHIINKVQDWIIRNDIWCFRKME